MGNLVPATYGVSNFVTSPDYIETILILNATSEQIDECMAAVEASGQIYNVYVGTANSDPAWLLRIESKSDRMIDAALHNPADYFYK